MRRRHEIEMNEFAEINITPFTDVILVLLIIFMITSPFLISGAFHVKLPTSVASETQVNQSVEVFLTEKNEIIINNNKIDAANFAGTLQAEFQKRNNFDVIIKADKNVLHGNFVRMLDLIKLSGAQKILVATTKATDKK